MKIMFRKTHKIKFDNKNNTLTISFNGLYDSKDMQQFIDEYLQSKINMPKRSITLVIDALRLSIVEPDTFKRITDVSRHHLKNKKIYLGYKAIYILKSLNSIANIQLQTFFNQTNIQDNIQFIKSKNDIQYS